MSANNASESGRGLLERIARALPTGWRLEVDTFTSSQRIVRTDPPAHEWQDQSYGLRVPADESFVVFTHGNNDMGCKGVDGSCLSAVVVDARDLDYFGIEVILRRLVTAYKPDEWGYT